MLVALAFTLTQCKTYEGSHNPGTGTVVSKLRSYQL